jgi:diketogulonate reductase-like aldo/keto reductase
MNESMEKMKRKTIDLMQIHNLVDWQVHLQTLRRWKEQGIVKYIGITHYTDSMHDDLVRIIKREPIDFVQFNYSLLSRHAEETLLPVAAEKGVATIINRPFGEGAWFNKMRGKNLPPWAADYGITSWSQFFLKFIIGHPAVTCVIPATSNPEHMQENCAATEGTLPDDKARAKMAAWVSEW